MIAISSGTLAAAVGGGVVLGVFFRKHLRAFIQREGRGHARLVVLLIVLTGLLYSVPHEFRHKVVAESFGGEVRSVTWTIFGGEPRVVYERMPDSVRPWASAAGLFVPILLALVLMAARLGLGQRLPRWANAMLSVPAAVIFLASLGCVIPALFGGGHSCITRSGPVARRSACRGRRMRRGGGGRRSRTGLSRASSGRASAFALRATADKSVRPCSTPRGRSAGSRAASPSPASA